MVEPAFYAFVKGKQSFSNLANSNLTTPDSYLKTHILQLTSSAQLLLPLNKQSIKLY